MNGILIINKPKGCTSHDIVYKIKKIVKEKVGHTGTLDPMATGVLPLLIGKGTLCSKYLINHDKKYLVELQLGKKTDTADSEGKIIEEKDVKKEKIEKKELEEILNKFIGKQKQIPPIYSAIKVNGRKLYEYARKGQTVEIKSRQIEIYDIELTEVDMINNKIEFKVSCSKGTYIRSLCEDIAEKLDTVGYMSNLKRLQVGDFKIEDALSIEKIEKINVKEIENKIITIEKLFENKEKIYLDDNKLQLFLNGVKLKIDKENDMYRIYNQNRFIGIGIVKDNLLKRDIIL